MPPSVHPSLLVGLESRDDAGVFALSEDQALVQTVDFFTPIVDDPYAYGAIAAANALSDIYAMGGRPLTVLNIACFDPSMAGPEVWASVLRGAYDKTLESGAVVLGGHSVEDTQPKFGMAVTGLVNPKHMFANTGAKPGDRIFLSKPIGTGVIATAAKRDQCPPEMLAEAIRNMATLNREACKRGLAVGVRCATDITGFGLLGHLMNVANSSAVRLTIDVNSVPLLPGLRDLVDAGLAPGGATKNLEFVRDRLEIGAEVEPWHLTMASDPQTSGGLALFSTQDIEGYAEIGVVEAGEPGIRLR